MTLDPPTLGWFLAQAGAVDSSHPRVTCALPESRCAPYHWRWGESRRVSGGRTQRV